MFDQHDRGRPLPAQVGEDRHQRRLPGRIEVRGRLVEDQQPGLRREGPRQGETLLLPPGQSSRPPSLEPGQPGVRQRDRNAGVHPVERPGPVLEPERDVILDPLHDELGRGILEHQPDSGGDPDRADLANLALVQLEPAGHGGRDLVRDQAGERERERALARPRRADHEQEAAGLEVEREVLERWALGASVDDPRGRARGSLGWCQSGKPSRTPARLSERWIATDPPATITIAEIPIATPRTIWRTGSTSA